jgi:putative tricarboxylic transport membrane protein
MKLKDTLAGALLLVFGGAVVAYAASFTGAPGQKVSPALFPSLIGGGLALGGAALIWADRKNRGAPAITREAWTREPRQALKVSLIPSALICYALFVETAGFFATSILFLVALLLAFGARPRWIAPLAVGVTLAIHFMFYSLLRVPLPWGWLEGIAW